MTQPDQPLNVPAPRRHDLDALRAFAMLLGIALHAGLAFAPIPWLAMNKETSSVVGTFVEVVHGFRLPLFFIMSGYFSMMLLRRRGVGGFVGHRWKRIGLPLLLGCVTVIPAMWGVIIGGNALKQAVPVPEREWGGAADEGSTIWSASAAGDVALVQELVRSGAAVDEPDGRFFTLPLSWAAMGDHADVVALLLEAGADPNQRMGDDNTPLHTACFFGAPASAALMLEAGADAGIANVHGETPVDAMKHGAGVVDFIANLLGIEVDFQRVEAGRTQIRDLFGASGEQPAGPRIGERLIGLLQGEVFMHLWFLWHLCWLGAGLVVVVILLRALPLVKLPDAIIATPVCLVVLLPLTGLTQSWQANFGPDTSAALIPDLHVLAHYAVFFGFGALMHGTSAADRLGHAWWVYLPIAALACVLGLRLTHDPSAFLKQGVGSEAGTWAGAALQAVFVWTISFGLMGLARRLLSRASERVRYVSDSSYWLYVTHLPLVVGGQFGLAYVPLPPIVEFVLLTVATTLVLLVSYRLFVRYTWIGRLLNGRRERPGAAKIES